MKRARFTDSMTTTQNFLFLFLNLDTTLSNSTPENFATFHKLNEIESDR